MNWLIKLKNLIDTEFNSGWIEDLIPTVSSPELFEKAIREKEFQLLPRVYEFLNFSVLEGEFINHPDDFREILSEVYSKISNLQSPVINNDPDYSYTSILEQYKFFYSVKKAIELYNRVAKRISTLIYNPEKTFVIDFASTTSFEGYREYFAKKGNTIEEPLFDLFYENLVISEEGFFLSNNDSQFFDLLKKIDTLKNIKTKIDLAHFSFQETIDALIEICVFYQRKLIIRKYQDDEKFNQKYLYELEETNFNLDEHKLEKDFLLKWDNYSQNHYLSEKNQERTNILKIQIEQKLKSPIDGFLTSHSLIKFFKDINRSDEKLMEIGEYFEGYLPTSKFNQFAKNVSMGYLLNNKLSKKLENIDTKEIENKISEINKYQEKCNMNNYFPYYKICKFLKKKIELEFVEIKKGKHNFEQIKNQIIQLRNLFTLFKIKVKWSKTHLSYAYQLPFDECVAKTNIGENEINIFIPSTFSLPLSYDKFDSFSDKLNNFLLFCENELKSLENFYSLNKKITEKEKEISEVLKDQAKKNIELLGIFSAIIALLYQGIITANTESSLKDKVYVFCLMFLTLFAFLILLKTIISKSIFKEATFIWVSSIILLIIASATIIISVI